MSKTVITRKYPAVLSAVPTMLADDNALHDWILKNSTAPLTYLLGHADDGVIWGRIDIRDFSRSDTAKSLTIGSDVMPEAVPHLFPSLSLTTLQTLRLFSEASELLLWRTATGWSGRLIEDAKSGTNATYEESFHEDQMLWGTRSEGTDNQSFTLLMHGQEGLRHVVPLDCKPTSKKPLKLRVRHYLNKDGMARVVASRLVKFVTD